MSNLLLKYEVSSGVAGLLAERHAKVIESWMNEHQQLLGERKAYDKASEVVWNQLVTVIKVWDVEGKISQGEKVLLMDLAKVARGSLISMHQTADVHTHILDGQIRGIKQALTDAVKVRDDNKKLAELVVSESVEDVESEDSDDDRFGGKVRDKLGGRFGRGSSDAEDLSGLTISELRSRLKESGIKSPARASKQDLVNLLQA